MMTHTTFSDGTQSLPASVATFSLSFAQPTCVNGVVLQATVPGTDGTIGAPTRYESGRDGIVKQDEDEGEDE